MIEKRLKDYIPIVGEEVIAQLEKLSQPLKGKIVVHINSTRVGGGVAEILERMVLLMNELGLKTYWEVIEANSDFFQITKKLHNSLQGWEQDFPQNWFDRYLEVNEHNAEKFRNLLYNADFVFIHDPQPLPLAHFFPKRKGKWIWRCHIDLSNPWRPVWKLIRPMIKLYDASIFSLVNFSQNITQTMYIIPPSIDPLSEKNCPLTEEELDRYREEFGLDPKKPVLLQVSRFDRFKDPLGVIQAFKMVREFQPAQLVLAGGGATDDPEGEVVLKEVMKVVEGEDDIHILNLPPESDRKINALQRLADIVLQKSLREGFGLTVTEALWKSKPVIGGDVGGIKLQVVNYHTGFLVNTPEGAALRIRYLLEHPELIKEMGEKGHRYVKENFLLTRHIRDYLVLMLGLMYGGKHLIEL